MKLIYYIMHLVQRKQQEEDAYRLRIRREQMVPREIALIKLDEVRRERLEGAVQINQPRSIEDFYLEQKTRRSTSDEDLYQLLQVYSTPEFAAEVLSELLIELIPQERLLLVNDWGVIKKRVKKTLGGKSSKSRFVKLLLDFARGTRPLKFTDTDDDYLFMTPPNSLPVSRTTSPITIMTPMEDKGTINVVATPVDAHDTPEVKAMKVGQIIAGMKRSITVLKNKNNNVALDKNKVIVTDKNGVQLTDESDRLTNMYSSTENARKLADMGQVDYKFSDYITTGNGLRGLKGKHVYKKNAKRHRIITGRGANIEQINDNKHGNSKLGNMRRLNKYLISADKLSDNIIDVRLASTGNKVLKGFLSKPTQISPEVSRLIEDICEDEFSLERYNKLPKNDKNVLYNFLDAAHVEINGLQNSDDKELEHNVLLGEYKSGNRLPYIKFLMQSVYNGSMKKQEMERILSEI